MTSPSSVVGAQGAHNLPVKIKKKSRRITDSGWNSGFIRSPDDKHRADNGDKSAEIKAVL